MSTTAAVLNAIRNSASTEYASRVPDATETNITTVGNAILSHTDTINEFTNALIGKIGASIFSDKMAQNRLAKFKKGQLLFGMDVEEIFVSMATAEGAFDKTGANPLGRRKPNVKTIYHRQNRQDKYVVSISKAQVHNAFRTSEGVMDLLTASINSLYSGANQDEYLMMKNLLATYEANFYDYGVTAITDSATAQAFVRSVRKAVADMSFVSTTFNKQGVPTFTAPENQVLIINKDVLAHVDVDVLSKCFQLGTVSFEADIVVVDDFGTMTNTYGVLVDKSFFMVWDTLNEVVSQFNADGLFTNYFFHVHQILSTSQFKNAIRFTTSPKA